jgi:GT2 family glycosyltransferase
MSAIISTIIVNYNAGELLRSCVDSLLNCPLEIEIIVVDNASMDGSLDALLCLPYVHIIKNSTNVGFAAACNSGVRVASAPFLLFINPDCLFESGTLVRLLDEMGVDKRVGMVGGLLTHPDGTRTRRGTSGRTNPLAFFCACIWVGTFFRSLAAPVL